MKNEVIVLFLALVLAAPLQEVWPPLPLVGGKPPWLAAVALYYGAERGPGLALVAAVLSGLLLDGLAGTPPGVSSLVLSSMLLLLRRLRLVFPARGVKVVLIGGAVAAPALLLVTALSLYLSHGVFPLAPAVVVLRLLLAVPLGAGAALAVRFALAGLDRIMGNVALSKKKNAIG